MDARDRFVEGTLGRPGAGSDMPGTVLEMPDWWKDVPPPLKAAYWHVRLFKEDPLVLIAVAQDLASNNSVADQAAQRDLALPDEVPHAVQRTRARLTAERPARADSEGALRRGRKRGRAWEVEEQLVNELVAGVVDVGAQRAKVAAHARALLKARGVDYRIDYSRTQLDSVVRTAIRTAKDRLARGRGPGRGTPA